MRVEFDINGRVVAADIEPRTHLADFLREQRLLTGTHLGCEHGVCGACTLLLDGEPVRSCITLAVECAGRSVTTIEGLEDDLVTTRLRAAFTAEHALQCGYCTPGMLATARDIVRRLPEADEDRIRLELAGNLCRCTGYNGIVRAIARVLAERLDVTALPQSAVARAIFAAPVAVRAPVAAMDFGAGGNEITERVRIAVPRAAVWAAVQDPALIASCVPGVSLGKVGDGDIEGSLQASLGPISARFSGTAHVDYAAERFGGTITGEGRDGGTGTRLSVQADFSVEADGAAASVIVLNVRYALHGALAQFGRGPVVRAFAAELAEMVGQRLQARLRGEAAPVDAAPLSGGRLVLRAIWRWLRGLISSRDER